MLDNTLLLQLTTPRWACHGNEKHVLRCLHHFLWPILRTPTVAEVDTDEEVDEGRMGEEEQRGGGERCHRRRDLVVAVVVVAGLGSAPHPPP